MGFRTKLVKGAFKLAKEVIDDHGKGDASRPANSRDGSTQLTLKEKEAYFFEKDTQLMNELCLKLGLRVPLVVWRHGDNGEGLCITYFANEQHMFDFCYKLRCETPSSDNSINRAYVIEKAREDSDGRAVVHIQDGVPTCVVEVFRSYEELVDCQYQMAVKSQQFVSERQQEEVSTESELAFQQAEMQAHRAQTEIFLQGSLARQQVWGIAPTKYVNGVPYYNGPFSH